VIDGRETGVDNRCSSSFESRSLLKPGRGDEELLAALRLRSDLCLIYFLTYNYLVNYPPRGSLEHVVCLRCRVKCEMKCMLMGARPPMFLMDPFLRLLQSTCCESDSQRCVLIAECSHFLFTRRHRAADQLLYTPFPMRSFTFSSTILSGFDSQQREA